MNLFKKKEKKEKNQDAVQKNATENNDVIQEKSLKKYNKIKLSDKISLKMRKRMFVSKMFTFFIVLDLLIAFVGINLIVDSLQLESIDITKNKVYTLSDESKEVIKDINQDVKVYVYGIEEDGNGNILIDLLRQYNRTNEKITYEVITEENNYDKVKEFELESGDIKVIVESGNSKKIYDSSEFYDAETYYSTGEYVDLTEEILTNAILAMVSENKAKVYFLAGHGEYDDSYDSSTGSTGGMYYLSSYLKYESIEVETLNLSTSGNIPDDCKVLAILSPLNDLLDSEAKIIIDYVNKGGNLFIAQDCLTNDVEFKNLQKVLDLYGVKLSNCLIKENSANDALQSSKNIFRPQASSSSEITAEISSSNQGVILAYAQNLEFVSDEELEKLNVTREDLLTTSDSAQISNEISDNMEYGEKGQYTVSSLLTKKVGTVEKEENEAGEDTESNEENSDESINSKLIIIGNGLFLSDMAISQVSQYYPMFLIKNNKDFALNALGSLSEKEASLSIRKSIMSSSYTYTVSTLQRIVVGGIITIVPILIIIAGLIVGGLRKKRK